MGGLRRHREGGGDGSVVVVALVRRPSDDAGERPKWGLEARPWAGGRTCPKGRCWHPRHGE